MITPMSVVPGERAVRVGSPRLAPWLRAVVDVPDRLRRSDYVAIGTSARFRAHQRRRTVFAARVGFLVIAASSIFDGLALTDRQPSEAGALAILNGGVPTSALTVWG